jgi:hypothetical protein
MPASLAGFSASSPPLLRLLRLQCGFGGCRFFVLFRGLLCDNSEAISLEERSRQHMQTNKGKSVSESKSNNAKSNMSYNRQVFLSEKERYSNPFARGTEGREHVGPLAPLTTSSWTQAGTINDLIDGRTEGREHIGPLAPLTTSSWTQEGTINDLIDGRTEGGEVNKDTIGINTNSNMNHGDFLSDCCVLVLVHLEDKVKATGICK